MIDIILEISNSTDTYGNTMKTSKLLLPLALIGLIAAPTTYAAETSTKELHKLIKLQQKQLETLEAQMEATATQIETTMAANAKGAGKTSIGGYGELHYNNLKGEGTASDKKEIDFHRFVMFFGHEFSRTVRFWSELELEHSIAGESKAGEIELEQAYIEVDLNQKHKTRFGMTLVPVGIMNETHEPTVFYGTERNPVEKNIIPATWWAGGVSVLGELAPGWSYEVAVHEGLNTSAAKSYKPRDGRQKTGKAQADNLAYTGRIKWTGLAGVEVAATVQQQTDITQGNDITAGSANLFELHGIYNSGPFTLKALYAQWSLDGTGPQSIGADEQSGWYIEPSFKINEKIGVFARYNQYDNAAGNNTASEKQQTDVGVNWWVHSNVVVKADYQTQDNDGGKNQNGFNLGMGYMF